MVSADMLNPMNRKNSDYRKRFYGEELKWINYNISEKMNS